MRILAVDWGERRVGLAVSDPTGIIATGIPTLSVRGPEDALEQLAAIAAEREVTHVVVGLPLLMSGEKGKAAHAAEAFARAIAARTGLPVETWDERLTSVIGARRIHETGGRPSRTRGRVDQHAAAALLESYLQRLARRPERP